MAYLQPPVLFRKVSRHLFQLVLEGIGSSQLGPLVVLLFLKLVRPLLRLDMLPFQALHLRKKLSIFLLNGLDTVHRSLDGGQETGKVLVGLLDFSVCDKMQSVTADFDHLFHSSHLPAFLSLDRCREKPSRVMQSSNFSRASRSSMRHDQTYRFGHFDPSPPRHPAPIERSSLQSALTHHWRPHASPSCSSSTSSLTLRWSPWSELNRWRFDAVERERPSSMMPGCWP
jgi:hypothetical protein